MKMHKVGSYKSFTLEDGDMVVLLGNLEGHKAFLSSSGFQEHPETGEWIGTGAKLYAMQPEAFYNRFSATQGGDPELVAQATDGKDFYRIDGLPLVEQVRWGLGFLRLLGLNLGVQRHVLWRLSEMGASK